MIKNINSNNMKNVLFHSHNTNGRNDRNNGKARSNTSVTCIASNQ